MNQVLLAAFFLSLVIGGGVAIYQHRLKPLLWGIAGAFVCPVVIISVPLLGLLFGTLGFTNAMLWVNATGYVFYPLLLAGGVLSLFHHRVWYFLISVWLGLTLSALLFLEVVQKIHLP